VAGELRSVSRGDAVQLVVIISTLADQHSAVALMICAACSRSRLASLSLHGCLWWRIFSSWSFLLSLWSGQHITSAVEII